MRRTRLLARSQLALLLSALLGLSATGCGSSGKTDGPSRSASRTATTPETNTILTTSAIPPGQRLRGDGDADNPGDIDGNGDIDPGKDFDQDHPVPASYRFPDQDDSATFSYGRRPSALESHTIASVVKRYYAAASTREGATACSLLRPSLARSVSETYGQRAGPPYLRGGKTCQAVLSLLFTHFHEQLAEAITVVQVRVEGASAQVVLSSRRMPASELSLARQGSSWKVVELLGRPLP